MSCWKKDSERPRRKNCTAITPRIFILRSSTLRNSHSNATRTYVRLSYLRPSRCQVKQNKFIRHENNTSYGAHTYTMAENIFHFECSTRTVFSVPCLVAIRVLRRVKTTAAPLPKLGSDCLKLFNIHTWFSYWCFCSRNARAAQWASPPPI